jgi:tetratricopeptide (TPR) repeat protein
MSRFYLIALFYLTSNALFAQNELSKYLDFAEKKQAEGDYIYALHYYEKAMELDSNSVAILWKYAETLKAYKDYPKAAYYYQKVYGREETHIYPYSLLNWALMEKQQGHYQTAIDLLQNAKKKYAANKKTYAYLKSKRELESCLWAQANQLDTLKLAPVILPETINSANSEFAHTVAFNQLFFSSLRADSISEQQEIIAPVYRNSLFTKSLDSSSLLDPPSPLKLMADEQLNTGNGSFSIDGSRFYFSVCAMQAEAFDCQIAVVQKLGEKWGEPTLLGEIINVPGANTTTPSIALVNQEEWLFFSSNRDGGEGGMDIYYAPLKNNGNQFGKVKSVSTINSPDNEIAPWMDQSTHQLYFSSTWWNGYGGYDVFYTDYKDGQFNPPQNVGIPINSQANDVYYFRAGDTTFVSSNRLGVEFVSNPTCCSDVFAFSTPQKIVAPPSKAETLADLNKRLPVTLYFHNDVPNPRSKETTTKVNYIDSYNDYMAMIPEYAQAYSKGLSGDKATDAVVDIENFFTSYVDKGVSDLQLFQKLLLEELQKGLQIRLNVRGFASPLAKTDYNVALTQRRIQSLKNYLMVTDNGVFEPYLNGSAINGGKLEVVGIPFGEYTANQITSDNPNDLKNAVFSRSAAIERKIEIQSVSYIQTDSLYFLAEIQPTSIVLGRISILSPTSCSFTIQNTGNKPLALKQVIVQDTLFLATYPHIVPEKEFITVQLNTNKTLPKGLFSVPITIYFENYELPLRLLILGEGYEP